jgi:hypothetical protein
MAMALMIEMCFLGVSTSAALKKARLLRPSFAAILGN